MPAKKRLTMRQLRALLRLKHGGARLSDRTLACRIGVARSTIQDYLARVEAAGLSWPLPRSSALIRSRSSVVGPDRLP